MSLLLFDDFSQGLSQYWQRVEQGGAQVTRCEGGLRLLNPMNSAQTYINAQIDDYRHLKRSEYLWRPPLRMTVRARFSHDDLLGTAGFGFWNEPFSRSLSRWPSLPRAIWFMFSGPSSDMSLALGVPGRGWKAATFDARQWLFLLLMPAAPIAFLLMRIPSLYRHLWPLGQRALGVSEVALPAKLADWHLYEIQWERDRALFWVDKHLVIQCNTSPAGPLGLVIWMDNQYMVVTPQGRFGNGLETRQEPQWLELDYVRVEAMD